MHLITSTDLATADEQFAAKVEERAQIAFAAGCLLAVKHARCAKGCHIGYDFVVLSPGEKPPADDWTVCENHAGRAAWRSA